MHKLNSSIIKRPRYIPFVSAKFRLTMGLIAMHLDDWIESDEKFGEELELKDRLFSERFEDVFQTRPNSRLAQQEVLHLLIEHMVRLYPDLIRSHEGVLEVVPIKRNYRVEDYKINPLNLAGRLVQEDLCLMAPSEKGYTLEAASLCFPSRWRLADKMGKQLAAIHSPVPGFEERLSAPVNRFFDHLNVDRPVCRVNWSLVDDPTLYQPVRRKGYSEHSVIKAEDVGEKIFIRCERQTLRRLPRSGWVLFTIKTYLDPISSLKSNAGAIAALAASVRGMPRETQMYKNITSFRSVLLSFLDKHQTPQ